MFLKNYKSNSIGVDCHIYYIPLFQPSIVQISSMFCWSLTSLPRPFKSSLSPYSFFSFLTSKDRSLLLSAFLFRNMYFSRYDLLLVSTLLAITSRWLSKLISLSLIFFSRYSFLTDSVTSHSWLVKPQRCSIKI